MTRTVLEILVVVGAATGKAGSKRSDDNTRPDGPRVVSQPGGMFSHSICDCYDFAVPAAVPRVAVTSGGMRGPHILTSPSAMTDSSAPPQLEANVSNRTMVPAPRQLMRGWLLPEATPTLDI